MVQLSTSFWAADESVPVVDLTVGDLLREAVGRAPDTTALVAGTFAADERRRWSYAELLAECERAARALLTRFSPGDRVALWANNIPEWVILEYAAALAGITLVTVNPALRAEELAYVLRHSRSEGIFLVPEYRGSAMAEMLDSVRGEVPALRETILLTEWEAFCASGSPNQALPEVDPAAPAQIQYTSGTTGRPKGAVLHHRGIVNNARIWNLDVLGVPPGTAQLTAMPLFHCAGCVLGVLGSAACDGTLILPPYFDPPLLLELIEAERPTCFVGVPTMLIACLDDPNLANTDVSSVRWVASGGSVVLPELVRRVEDAFGAPLCIVYGQTEASPLITAVSAQDAPADRLTTVGRPLGATAVKIVDPASGETVPLDTDGELCTRGYLVMAGYFDNPEATASTIDRDGWLHTGDLAAMDSRGYCRITGRLKDMIIRGGENIYPREIEQALFEHGDVADVAVVGVPDELWGEQAAAFIRPAQGRILDLERLRVYCGERLAPHKVPRHWITVDEFPVTPSGKVQKYALRERFLTPAPADASSHDHPKTVAQCTGDESVPILELSIGGLLRATAARTPDAVALVAGTPAPGERRRWTYAELLVESEGAARALLTRFSPGDRVAVWANNIPEWVFLELAAGMAGITLVTANPALRADELAYVLRHSRSDGVFYVPEYQGFRMAETLDGIRGDLPNLRETISFADWEAFCASGCPTQQLPDVDPKAPAHILYTSGTTGLPKGAVLHHRGLVNSARIYVDALGVQPGMVQLGAMPLFHIVGCGLTVLGTFASAGTLVLMPYFDPSLLLTLIEEEGVAWFFGVPTMHVACLEDPRLAATDVSSVRLIVAAGAPVLPLLAARVEEAFEAPLCIGFGQTETSGCITQVVPNDESFDRHHTIGKPVAHTEVKVIDPTTGETVGTDVDGELCTRGYFVMTGYFDNPAATAAAIDAEEWLHTGDLAAMDSRGYVRITGRLKDMIIRGGENIYPREIEQVLFEHEDVADVAVLGVADPTWGEQVAAFVRPTAGRTPDAERLRRYCAERLALHKVPLYWVVVDEFPTTPSGKIQKFILRERFAASAPAPAAATEDEDELLVSLRRGGADQPVADAIRLGVQVTLGCRPEELRGDATFTEMGGDSLSALRFSRLIEEILNIELPVGAVIDPTNDLDGLTNYIEKNRETAETRATSAVVHGRDIDELRASDLTLDKFIDAPTIAGATTLDRPSGVQTVLLTGATGYLGRFLCMEWLARLSRSEGKLICITRARDAGAARQRITASLERDDPDLASAFRRLAADHLEVIAGDVDEPNFGLDEAAWHRLANTVDLVVHAAALVNHMLPYSQLFGPNVAGTAQVIRLALTSKLKQLNYVSTVAVATTGAEVLGEDIDVRVASPVRKIDQTYANGYANSKWAGEVLMREAHDLCGVPVGVFRCDMILAHSRYVGQLNVSDLFTRLILSLIVTGIAPYSFYELDGQGERIRAHYDGLPVDFVAEALATLGANVTEGYRTYNVVNSHDDGISLDQVVDWLIDAGHAMERIHDYADWLSRFESAMRVLPDTQRQHSELELLDAFKPPAPALTGPVLPAESFRDAVRAAQIGADRDIPHMSAEFIGKYVSDLRQLQLL
jgi:thioester reductase-like protein